MTTKKFSSALGNIGESYVDEAVNYTPKRKKNSWVKWVSVAACISLIVMGGIFGSLFYYPDTPDVPKSNITSYFVITAHAANGESTDLTLADGCFNSAPAQEGNGFGVDMPLFCFDVKPSDLENNEAVYERFDISISYNGTTVSVTDKDEHVQLRYLIPTPNSNESWSYSITGWFAEPTDIIVHILDKESREIVEIITVNVNYLADKQEYELKVTNLTTKFSEQKEAVSALNFLVSYFVNRGYVTNYPEWFGGCYIEKNKLHIKLVSPSDEEMKNISQILAPFDDVIVYENAEMSMSELQAHADKTAKELMENEYAVTSWYVDSITGNIIISVLEKDFEAVTKWINTAAENGNAPKIVIEIGEYIDLEKQTIEFCAEPIFENGAISWMYSINVKIDNGKIYLNEILYDQVSYVEDMKLDWGTPLSGNNRLEMMIEAIGKINSQKGCYILETTSVSKYGKIAMYVIGDTYYFIRFYDNGQVMRVHSGTVQ